ncbi:hypothetical protein Psta_1708 [Pirellula staleyi DSM 6068]|uniref:Uncharacterized protein n=1 Tax=Pirellula staleyi (strain ATCC 27377 / DSM 6068 / ICPB 4128) TaxID=530564 RepID=D2QYS8_PIRSD|nr:hypothetical protein [Pirellula staleyi]ADB16383.1 hypothetical protein Psta_1708 [Pirellula staleyi DSM 6068]
MARTLDLIRDKCQIQEYIWNRLNNYDPDWERALGDAERKVSLIATGFSFEQTGWFSMVLDRRPRAQSDGEWQSHIGNNYLPMPHWVLDGVYEIDVKHYDKKWKPPRSGFNDDSVATLFGDTVRDAILHIRNQDGFKFSFLARNCAFFVEEHEGRYGWPEYKALRKEGRCKP